jgi:hypothetical protein
VNDVLGTGSSLCIPGGIFLVLDPLEDLLPMHRHVLPCIDSDANLEPFTPRIVTTM